MTGTGMASPPAAPYIGAACGGPGAGSGMTAPPADITSAVPATTIARRGACEGGKRCRCSIASCVPTPGSSHG